MDTNKQEKNQEAVEQETVVEEVNPLSIRVVLLEGSPLEFMVNNMVQGQFREWITQNVANQVNNDGIFLGNTYIPNSKIKYFEEA
ncbi:MULTISPECIES: hypothetical protein [Bacillus cereus group]|uniref:hypothetical protein n=1 Tax=Bacillus cereus group TaxID=86661 RepID=UPI0029C58C70|nr:MULTISPECIES: hypothetical protein [Bacillus cereus group]MDX5884919.1 hypothetical protein [Bacillus cereus group sp. BfR-BA-00999]MDX6046767.1 hypothetical protein [Bacillus paranthracis]